jgi:hypothetical protein
MLRDGNVSTESGQVQTLIALARGRVSVLWAMLRDGSTLLDY